MVVELSGQCADYEAIAAECRKYDVPLVEDAAEALGGTYQGRQASVFGDLAIFSFNGNKITTASWDGALSEAARSESRGHASWRPRRATRRPAPALFDRQ